MQSDISMLSEAFVKKECCVHGLNCVGKLQVYEKAQQSDVTGTLLESHDEG
jgi:hypothetical protein